MAIVSTTSSSVQGIKCVSVHDIPKLQLWLDASDGNTVTTQPLFTDWSWYFSGDSYLTTPSNANVWNLGDTFTIEFYIYPYNSSNQIFEMAPWTQPYFKQFGVSLSNGYPNIFWRQNTGGQFPSTGFVYTNIKCNLNEWNHVAFSSFNNSVSAFVNGVYSDQTIVPTWSYSNDITVYFGNRANGYVSGSVLNGFLSNFRVFKNVARYTSSFTIPTAPLPLNEQGLVFQAFTRSDTLVDYSSNVSFSLNGSIVAIDPNTGIFNQWSDKSPNQISLTQTFTNNKPTYKTQEINGLNVVVFDGSDDFLNLSQSIPINNANWSHFFVYRRPSNGTYTFSIGNGNVNENSNAFLHWNNNYVYSGDRYTNSSVLSTGVNVGAVSKNELMFLNNTKLPYVGGWGPNTNASTLGKYYSSYYHNDAICEVIHTDAKLPEYELRFISNRLIEKWKIPNVPPQNNTLPLLFVNSVSSLATTNGTWFMEPSSYDIQWQSSTNGITWNNISLQISSVFVPTSLFENSYIRTSVQANNLRGASSVVYSNVLQLTTTNIIAPQISFISNDSSVIALTANSWSSTLPLTSTNFQWLSSTNGTTWATTNFSTSAQDFYGYNNTYVKLAVKPKTSIATGNVDSNVIFTGNINNRIVLLLLKGDVTYTESNGEFLDESNNKFVVTKTGNPAQGTFTPFSASLSSSGIAYNPSIHGGSVYVSPGDYLSTSSSGEFAFGTGDFTVEFWMYSFDTSGGTQLGMIQTSDVIGGLKQDYGSGIVIGQGQSVPYQRMDGGINANVAGVGIGSTTPKISTNKWHHVALVRQSGTATLYVDGSVVGSASAPGNCYGTHASIGGYYNTSYSFSGYLANLRIVKGSALYTAPFTPPTSLVSNTANTALLLNFTNGLALDSRAKNNLIVGGHATISNVVKKYGVGSFAFDGSGDYLTLPANSWNFNSGDFTIEAWINLKVKSGSQIIGSHNHGTDASWLFYVTSSTLGFAWNTSGDIQAPCTMNVGQWHHVAVTRQGNNLMHFLDGAQIKTTAFTATINSDSRLITIGADFDGNGSLFNGYIDDLRVTTGVARYTGSTYVVPADTLPNTSSSDSNFSKVSLLLQADKTNPKANSKDIFIDNGPNKFIITKIGNVAQGTFSPFIKIPSEVTYNPSIHGGSAHFNGSGSSNLLYAPIDAFNFRTDNFTVEFWIYPIYQSSYGASKDFSILGAESPGSGALWGISVTGYNGFRGLTFEYGVHGSYVTGISTNNWLRAEKWQHIAITRQGSTWRIFVDGVEQTLAIYNEGGTWNPSFDFNNTTTQRSRIGTAGHSNPFYLSDVRFVKGTALYTINFTPPTAPLTAVSGTSLLLNFTDASILDSTCRYSLATTTGCRSYNFRQKSGSGCMYFNGMDSYTSVQFPLSGITEWHKNEYTLEYWIKGIQFGSGYPVSYTDRVAWTAWSFGPDSTNEVKLYYWYGGAAIYTTSTALTANVWHHLALVQKNQELSMYIDGIRKYYATSFAQPPTPYVPFKSLCVGGVGFVGWIDDLRVCRKAIYTTETFVPPTTLTYP